MNPTIIWRHKKENLKKCSLKNLESRKDLLFFTYPKKIEYDLSNFVLLTIDAPSLSIEDKAKGLLFIDGTWRYAKIMENTLLKSIKIEKRSIPNGFKTAYPRKQTECLDPKKGLATLEAIYISYFLTKKDPEGLLDHYYFKNTFLEKNPILKTEAFFFEAGFHNN